MKSFRISLLVVATLFIARSAAAVMTFDGPKPIHGDDGTYYDYDPAIAGDGAGNWVAIWKSTNPAYPNTSAFSRSTDDGRTWTTASALPYAVAEVAKSSAGTCVAVGYNTFIRSSDHCATWSSPATLFNVFDALVSVATDSAGNWVAVAGYYNPGTMNREVASSHSVDDGLTWSAPTLVATSDITERDTPNIVTDGNGRWMSIWANHYSISYVSVSTDVGTTWSSPVSIGNLEGDIDLATDGSGTWIAAGFTIQPDSQSISVVVSTDDGASWTTPVPLKNLPSTVFFAWLYVPRVRYESGTWQILWSQSGDSLGGTIEEDGDLVGVRSFDGGATWTDPAAINVNAATGDAGVGDVACGASGTCILVYELGDVQFARSHDDCPSTPAPGCHVSTNPGASKIKLQNSVGGNDKMQWKWKSGEATLPSELGDPLTSSGYALCLYDDVGGTMKNVFEADAVAAATCDDDACWSSYAAGYRYIDRAGANGPLHHLTLQTGADGEAAIKVRASGPPLAPPVMPFAMSPAMIAQVINTENSQCWESSFSDPKTNTATTLKARSD